jgi:hydroxypyruvate isomerase
VQIADNPGRTEPGSGEINFESLFRLLHRLQYSGLVELEHGWLRPGIVSERNGLALLREFDAAAIHPFGARAGGDDES